MGVVKGFLGEEEWANLKVGAEWGGEKELVAEDVVG